MSDKKKNPMAIPKGMMSTVTHGEQKPKKKKKTKK